MEQSNTAEVLDVLESSSETPVKNESQNNPASTTQNNNEHNFDVMRKAVLKAEYERDLAQDQTVRMTQELKNQSSSLDKDDDLGIKDDEIAEGKHLRRLYKDLKQQKASVLQYQRKTDDTVMEAKILKRYPDFEAVVSPAKLKEFSEAEPELANSINDSSNLYNKAVSAYKLLKKFGIHKEDKFKEEKDRIDDNLAKPRAVSSVAPIAQTSPLSNASQFINGLSPERIRELRASNETALENY